MNAAPAHDPALPAAHGTGSRMLRALDTLDDGFALLDAEGRVLSCSHAFVQWHRYAARVKVTPGADLGALLAGAGCTDREWIDTYRAHLQASDGAWLVLEWCEGHWVRARFVRQDDGAVLAVIADMGHQRQSETRLEEAARRFRDFAETSGDWFWELDPQLRYRLHTVGSLGGAGCSTELAGESFIDGLRQGAVDPRQVEFIARRMDAHEAFRDCEVRLRSDDGFEMVCSLSGKPFAGPDGGFGGYRGSGRNVTEASGLGEKLAYQATHDDLTGLANRRALEARINEIIKERAGSPSQHALFFLDLDQLKVINDTCGHVAGDALLNHMARLLCQGLRGVDTIARLGGDEFAVLLRKVDSHQAWELAEKLRRGIAKHPFTWDGQQFRITASIGVAPLDMDMNDAGDLLRAADSACYAAKDRGRNRVKLYALDDSTLNMRKGEMHWVARIHAALAEGRLEVRLQPIVPTHDHSGRPRHFEVLLRMKGRDGRIFSPSEFLPAAERYNLASQIDVWVLDETLRLLQGSPRFVDRLHVMSVNLSGQSLGEPNFLEHVHNFMRTHAAVAPKLCFEITETAAISNLDRVREFMKGMREFGCSFALDDFGAGLSSFAYLRTLDVDYLKIDGMFVKDVHEDEIHEAMVRSINDVGHIMGKKTVAEFVENDAVRETLARIGVDYVQGYGVGEPQPFASVLDAS